MTERLVWFLLVDQEGVAYKRTSADCVNLPSNYVIAQFRDAVKAKYPKVLSQMDAGQLLVYADKTAFDANTADVPTNLQPEDDIEVYGAKDAKMYVVVPDGVVRDNSATTAPLTAEQMKMAVNEALEERDRKRSEYSISRARVRKKRFSSSNWVLNTPLFPSMKWSTTRFMVINGQH